MNKRFVKKLIFIALSVGMIIPMGFFAYSIANTTTASGEGNTYLEVSAKIQNKINEADPANFEKNMTNYTTMLVALDVHEKFKNEIERLIVEGHNLLDILIAYEFLYQRYGVLEELERIVLEKESGKSWGTVFQSYTQSHSEFIPRAFNPDYLEGLMKTPGITSDDIMIADRVSIVSGITVDELIKQEMEDATWKEINANLDIFNSSSQLPRVQITQDQLTKYMAAGLTEQQVAEAFVLANKLGVDAETIITKAKSGYNEDKIIAEILAQKYY